MVQLNQIIISQGGITIRADRFRNDDMLSLQIELSNNIVVKFTNTDPLGILMVVTNGNVKPYRYQPFHKIFAVENVISICYEIVNDDNQDPRMMMIARFIINNLEEVGDDLDGVLNSFLDNMIEAPPIDINPEDLPRDDDGDGDENDDEARVHPLVRMEEDRVVNNGNDGNDGIDVDNWDPFNINNVGNPINNEFWDNIEHNRNNMFDQDAGNWDNNQHVEIILG
jgi:hypothetical protein